MEQDPDSMSGMGGHIGFYKLNLEAALMAMWPSHAIIKPCGLGNGPPAMKKLWPLYPPARQKSIHSPNRFGGCSDLLFRGVATLPQGEYKAYKVLIKSL